MTHDAELQMLRAIAARRDKEGCVLIESAEASFVQKRPEWFAQRNGMVYTLTDRARAVLA
jgi:hypothetical protein